MKTRVVKTPQTRISESRQYPELTSFLNAATIEEAEAQMDALLDQTFHFNRITEMKNGDGSITTHYNREETFNFIEIMFFLSKKVVFADPVTVLTWIHNKRPQLLEDALNKMHIPRTRWGQDILSFAWQNNEKAICTWLFKQYPLTHYDFLVKTLKDNQEMYYVALSENYNELLDWIATTDYPYLFNEFLRLYGDKAFQYALSSGSLELVQWLLKKYHDQDNPFHKMSQEAISSNVGNSNSYSNLPFKSALGAAARSGKIEIIEWLANNLDPAHKEALFNDKKSYTCLLQEAVMSGSMEVVEWLYNYNRTLFDDWAKENGYIIFHVAASCGNIAALDWALKKCPHQLMKMPISERITMIQRVVNDAMLPVLQWLEKTCTPSDLKDWIDLYESSYRAWNDTSPTRAKLFCAAINCRSAPLLEWLINNTPSKLVEKNQDTLFCEVAKSGDVSLFIYMCNRFPSYPIAEKLCESNMLITAVNEGKIDILNFLSNKSGFHKLVEILWSKPNIFFNAIEKGNLQVLNWFSQELPELTPLLIQKNNFEVLSHLSQDSFKVSLNWLLNQPSSTLRYIMIIEKNYEIFNRAIMYGDIEVLNWLVNAAVPQLCQPMIESKKYVAFRLAAKHGQVKVLDWLAMMAPDKLEEMIQSPIIDYPHGFGFNAIKDATQNGNVSVLRWLLNKNQDKKHREKMANAVDPIEICSGLRQSDPNRDIKKKEIINLLLPFPKLFAYFEFHVREYGDIIRPFIENHILMLQQDQNRNRKFDQTQSRLMFYMVRHLIRLNTEVANDYIRYLLNIPEVRALSSKAVTPRQKNELLRLAISYGNTNAAAQLLRIPAVHNLAVENNFYVNEMNGGIDLRTLGEDRESSMTALTPGEQRRLEKITSHYKIDSSQLSQKFNELLESLSERYQRDPAKIVLDNGTELILPLTHQAFMQLRLSNNNSIKAMEAYYKHPLHTAYRFLSKPNPWISRQASYAKTDPQNPNNSWADFEGYKELIVLLWHAAKDEKQAPTNGYTLEARINQFISELASIGRAHNWDKTRNITRKRKSEEREEEFDDTEQYDDLLPDNPSCFSGMKRRLFQSLQGHPMITMLTGVILEQEIRSFVALHYNSVITTDNAYSISASIDKYLDELKDEDKAILNAYNISKADQDKFIDELAKKYGSEFESTMRQAVLARFQLEPHICTFHETVSHKIELLKSAKRAKSSSSSSSSVSSNTFTIFAQPVEDEKAKASSNHNLQPK